MICAACNRNVDEVLPLRSVLDFRTRFICGCCVDHQAEPPSVTMHLDQGFAKLRPSIASAVHVFHGEQYWVLSQWLEQKPATEVEGQERQPDAESDGDHIINEIMRMRPNLDAPRFDRRTRRTWSHVLALFAQFRRATA